MELCFSLRSTCVANGMVSSSSFHVCCETHRPQWVVTFCEAGLSWILHHGEKQLNYQFCDGKTEKGEKGELKKKKKRSQKVLFLDPKKRRRSKNPQNFAP